jgi:hypothetical protein
MYGIDTGTANNALVRLAGTTLTSLLPIKALPGGGIPDEAEQWPTQRWCELARAVSAELDQRELFPLGVDAALTLACEPPCRTWEMWARAFATPASLDPLPIDQGSRQQRRWVRMARLWTEVTHLLTSQYQWKLWRGEKVSGAPRLLIEVYPRMSWLSLAAFRGVQVRESWKRVGSRDSVLRHLNLTWAGSRPNRHARDAAVCALTVQAVMNNAAGFLGEDVTVSQLSALRGGGIAIPR